LLKHLLEYFGYLPSTLEGITPHGLRILKNGLHV
jgi:hypothetical protein